MSGVQIIGARLTSNLAYRKSQISGNSGTSHVTVGAFYFFPHPSIIFNPGYVRLKPIFDKLITSSVSR